MSTNFYLRKNICKHCGRSDDKLHIGKSSMGWSFTFRAHDDPFIHSVKDLKKEMFISAGRIFNEYGEEITDEDFWKLVKSKRKEPHNHALEYPSPNDWLDDKSNSFTRSEFS